ncbi:carboxypeptidase-like regulatory domain-containing protein [Curtobacterium pusillum]|uniref:carboxypeptidase-like regulatory domain-containing protein n=1 Tax=Curtobacterium pusillum TaxID=69373 RepID=UPI0011A6D21B|nr:carboxypeptidase-like regulatory domain-containing protein [Curtobacterium pusillum]
MRRWRAVTAGLTGIVLGAGLAIGGATSASAAPAGHWGTFTLSGSSKNYTGTMTLPGFPDTTFTSTSRQSTVISGASTWQGPSTGPGAAYGSSRGNTYINQRPNADSPNAAAASTTTYTFDGATPGNSSWSFVLGDIDADQATISATVQGGAPATAAQLGFQSGYNSCSAVSAGGWSCPADPGGVPAGKDVPTWDAATRTLTGNAAANDTSGATAWFTPTVPLTTLTITYQQRSGFPVYQTWFANRTAAITGTATLDGTPIPGATVTVTAPRGTQYTTTTGADGTYSFPELPVIGGYTVDITPPPNAEGTASKTTSLNTTPGGADQVVDFAFEAPADTVSVIGTVTDENGNPASNVPVVIIDPDDGTTLVDTTTNTDGVYTGSDLPADTDLGVSVGGADPEPIRTGDADAPPAQVPAIEAPPAVIATVTGVVSLDGTPVAAGRVVELLEGTTVVGSTTTDANGRYTFATSAGTYTVRTTVPTPGATGATENTGVRATAGSSIESDLAFATPAAPAVVTTDQPGTVTDTNGDPVAGVDVVATPTDPEAGAPVSTTTGADGTFDLTGLAPTTEYTVEVDGAEPQTITTPENGSATPLAITVPAAVVTPTPTPSPSAPAGGSGTTPVSSDGGSSTGGALAYTGADVTPGIIAAGVLVLLGAGLLTFRAVRNRRRTSHRQD